MHPMVFGIIFFLVTMLFTNEILNWISDLERSSSSVLRTLERSSSRALRDLECWFRDLKSVSLSERRGARRERRSQWLDF